MNMVNSWLDTYAKYPFSIDSSMKSNAAKLAFHTALMRFP